MRELQLFMFFFLKKTARELLPGSVFLHCGRQTGTVDNSEGGTPLPRAVND
jgi:hypothetical protein